MCSFTLHIVYLFNETAEVNVHSKIQCWAKAEKYEVFWSSLLPIARLDKIFVGSRRANDTWLQRTASKGYDITLYFQLSVSVWTLFFVFLVRTFSMDWRENSIVLCTTLTCLQLKSYSSVSRFGIWHWGNIFSIEMIQVLTHFSCRLPTRPASIFYLL